ncbi:MAG TPA: peptidylprolyl isomerase [Casimicrobiaceae bacterium]|nr:peptidylprolyl isomerase [Casimicrobiaceae bacterium]
MSRPDASQSDARVQDIQALLHRRAILVGLCVEDDDESARTAAIEALLDREVSVPAPSTEECRRWYDAHPDAFVAGEMAAARHILFAVTPGTPIDPLRRKAEATLQELRRFPERFALRARELSNCPSGAQDGSLGQLVRGECVPEFERVLFGSDAAGVLPTLVNTRFGFHIVAVDRRIPGQRVPFEHVQGQVAMRMAQQSWQRALAQYVEVLRNAERARGAEQANPLVQ